MTGHCNLPETAPSYRRLEASGPGPASARRRARGVSSWRLHQSRQRRQSRCSTATGFPLPPPLHSAALAPI
eukprot:1704943-Rhodomonas_salina.1